MLVNWLLVAPRGLGREVWAALLRVRSGPECPEGNLTELTWASKPREASGVPFLRQDEA